MVERVSHLKVFSHYSVWEATNSATQKKKKKNGLIFHTITAIVLPTCDIIPGGLSFSLLVYLAVGLLNPSWNYLNELHLGVTVLSVWPISFLLPFSILVIFDLLLWFFFSLSPRWWFFLIDLPSDWSLKTKCAVIYRNIQYNQFIFLLIILILFLVIFILII